MEINVRVPPGDQAVAMLGAAERNLKMIRETLGVQISSRDGHVRISGDRGAVVTARSVLERLEQAARARKPLQREHVLEMIGEESSKVRSRRSGGIDGLDVVVRGQPIRPKTSNQAVYLDAIRNHDLVFGIGPAGTGKTYLAVAAAVHMLRAEEVSKVVLVRPAVEAGEKLGYLPGDMQAKVNPYLRPLIDALHDMVDYPTIRRFMDHDVVEVVPLAFMRGRTLNGAVVILDEAQNTTKGQMKMFLTRMGQGSKMIVTGDTTQIDLPDPRESGLIDAARRLHRVPGIAFVTLTGEDVVRHGLVQRVIEAYERTADARIPSLDGGVADEGIVGDEAESDRGG